MLPRFAFLPCLLIAATAQSADLVRTETLIDFVNQHCLDCHTGEEPEAGLSLDHLTAPTKKSIELWQTVATQVASRNMPPVEHDQPTDETSDDFVAAVRVSLGTLGHELDVDYKRHQPAYANLLNHDRLFDRKAADNQTPAFSPPRLWRLHPEAYDLFLEGFGRQLSKGGPLSKPFLVGDGKGLASNYASLMRADQATLGQLILNCRQIADYQTVGFTRMEHDRKADKDIAKQYVQQPPSFKEMIESESPATQRQIVAAVKEEFQIVLNRAPSENELLRFAKLLADAIEVGGKTRGLRTLASAILLRPEAIYRMEVGLGESDQYGRRMLSPFELAHAIAYALTDTPPDKLLVGPPKSNDRNQRATEPSLLELAENGKLSTRDDVLTAVTTIWEAEYIEKPRVLRFFQEFFGYHKAESVFKGDRAGKEFAARFLVKDADTLVMHVVNEDRDVLKRLLTTDRYFVQWPGSLAEYERRTEYITKRIKPENTKDRNYKYFIERVESGLKPIPQANPTWRKTVRFYNLDENTWDYPLQQPFAMPAGQRAGILTHPAWLAAWSGNFGNDPIRRGKWIREHLLAGAIPDIPITVNAAVPEDPHKTLRNRLNVTRKDYCWQCHQKMEPLGLPFEAYDDFGQHRDTEGLGETKALARPKHTAPVVTSGTIIRSGDETIDGEVADATELVNKLAGSSRVRQSFTRHAFRYWMGRNEMLSDASVLINADDAYRAGQGSFKSLVISLLTSDSFLLRK